MMKRLLVMRVFLLAAMTQALVGCSSMPTWHGVWWGYAEPATVYDEHTNTYEVLQFRILQHPEAEPQEVYEEFVLRREDHPLLIRSKKICLSQEDLPQGRLLKLRGTMRARYVKDPSGGEEVERSVFTNYVGEEFIIQVDYESLQEYRKKP